MYTLTLTPISAVDGSTGHPYSVQFESDNEPYAVWRSKYLKAVAELIAQAEGAHPKFWNYNLSIKED